MLKGVISNFIVLTKLPRHVPASKCHPQGVTRSLLATPVLVCVSAECGLLTDWDAFCSRWPHQVNNSPHPPKTQTRTGVAYKEQVTPWGRHLDAETCQGNLMSTIKLLLTPLSICWFSFTRLWKSSVQRSRKFIQNLLSLQQVLWLL
jgi:hypothetical protein